jgi:arylsulfatase A-like enzyme
VASLFTSQYPTTHGAYGSNGALPAKAELLSESLGQRGYHCYGIYAHYALGEEYGLGQGFETFSHPRLATASPDGGSLTQGHTLSQEAKKLLLPEAEERGMETPFFLYLFYNDPSPPFLRHQGFSYTPYEGFMDGSLKSLRRLVRDRSLRQAHRGRMLNLYDGEVQFTDRQIGQVIDWLKESGEYDNTMIVVAGARGIDLCDHERLGHNGPLYQVLIRVPLIIKLPGGEFAGLRVPGQVSLVDLAPTVLDLLDQPIPESMQGISLRPALHDRLIPHTVFAEDPIHPKRRQCAIRAGFKLLRQGESEKPKKGWKLYYLSGPGGDRAGSRIRSDDRLAWMRTCLLDWERQVEVLAGRYSAGGTIVVRETGEMRREFVALGYSDSPGKSGKRQRQPADIPE